MSAQHEEECGEKEKAFSIHVFLNVRYDFCADFKDKYWSRVFTFGEILEKRLYNTFAMDSLILFIIQNTNITLIKQ